MGFEDFKLSIFYILFSGYVFMIEDILLNYYSKKNLKKIEKITNGAERIYKNKNYPSWKRAWMKARYKYSKRYLDKIEGE